MRSLWAWALEVIPFERAGEQFPVHQELLAKSGTYILEDMQTAGLAADGATEFMFVLGVPRFQGAVQMIATCSLPTRRVPHER